MPAKEDCAARSLIKGELRDEEKDVQPKGNGEDDSFEDEEHDEGTRNESRTENIREAKSSELSKENNESREEDSEETGTCEPKSCELSYNQRREKNIEENKRLLAEVMGGHPGLENKKLTKERRVSTKKAHSDEPADRRKSQRNRDNRRYCYNCDI